VTSGYCIGYTGGRLVDRPGEGLVDRARDTSGVEC
jgi:hypothetical protein